MFGVVLLFIVGVVSASCLCFGLLLYFWVVLIMFVDFNGWCCLVLLAKFGLLVIMFSCDLWSFVAACLRCDFCFVCLLTDCLDLFTVFVSLFFGCC